MELLLRFFGSKKNNSERNHNCTALDNNNLLDKLTDSQKKIIEDYYCQLETNFLDYNLQLFNSKKILPPEIQTKLENAKRSYGLAVGLALEDRLTYDEYHKFISKCYNINKSDYLLQIYHLAHGTIDNSNTMLVSILDPRLNQCEKTAVLKAAAALFRKYILDWLNNHFPYFQKDVGSFIDTNLPKTPTRKNSV